MKFVRWNPAVNMRWINEFDRYVDRRLEGPFWQNGVRGLAVDVLESEDNFIVKASVPGITPEDVEITFEDDVLTVKGEIAQDSEQEEAKYHIRERWYGSFSRRLHFPVNVDAEAIEATYENGILTLNVPKVEEEKPRRIEVRVG